MRLCHVVEIVTPKKVRLNGLWFGPASTRGSSSTRGGPKRPKRVILWVHGLGSSAFSKLGIVDHLIDRDTAVLTFNNRGHDWVASGTSGKNKTFLWGAGHEVFNECIDDIQGAIDFAKKNGAREIYIAGHSTGCQKSAYWACKKKDSKVKGVILLAPVSDFSAMVVTKGIRVVTRAVKIARKLVSAGKKHSLLPENIWPEPVDAQRLLSLYSGESEEEIFTYWNSERNPKTLHTIKLPLLVILAEKDEYADRPAEEIQDWFAHNIKVGDEIAIVKKAPHGFQGAEKRVADGIKKWILGHKSV